MPDLVQESLSELEDNRDAFLRNLDGDLGQRRSSVYQLNAYEVLFGAMSVVGWIVMFAAGSIVNSSSARTAIENSSTSLLGTLHAWFVIVTCYTTTNVAFLASLSAIAGMFSVRSRESELNVVVDSDRHDPLIKDVLACYAAASMRGFVIYLMIVSGLLLVTTEALAAPNQSQYVRLAGTISVLSFIAGYDSSVFKQALNRIVALISQSEGKSHRS